MIGAVPAISVGLASVGLWLSGARGREAIRRGRALVVGIVAVQLAIVLVPIALPEVFASESVMEPWLVAGVAALGVVFVAWYIATPSERREVAARDGLLILGSSAAVFVALGIAAVLLLPPP